MLFDQEHDLAEGLQQAMLPRTIPEVAGTRIAVRYRAARIGRNIGGDWYDVIPLPGGRVGLTIGDVQGHDTDAAVVMGQLRIVLWAYAAEGHPPATAMARPRPSCTSSTPTASRPARTRSSTCRPGCCRSSAPDTSTRWCAMPTVPASGSPRPAGCRSDSPPTSRGRAGSAIPSRPSKLNPGETLLLCTDGLVEQPGTDLGNRLTLLRETVKSGPAGVEELADRLGEAVGDQGGGDDVALLLLRRDDAS